MRTVLLSFIRIALLLSTVFVPWAAASAAQSGAHTRGRAGAPSIRCPQRNRPAGSVTISDNFYNSSLNPYLPTSSVGSYPLIFDDVFRWDSRAGLFPMMAVRIPTLRNGGIRDGGKTITIQLKRGLRWSNGQEITSADLKFGWEVGMDPVNGSCAGTCDAIHAITTPDRYTAVLHLQQIDQILLSPSVSVGGAMPMLWPVRWLPYWNADSHAAAIALSQDPTFTFIGPRFPTNGPYQAVRQSGNRTTFQPMRYYDDMTCGGYIRTLVYNTYNTGQTPSSAGQIAAALSGKTDVGLDYFSSDISSLVRHRRIFHVHIGPTFSFEHLVLNLDTTYAGHRNPLSDVRVRLALALALDKRSLVERALNIDQKGANHIIAWTPWINTPHLNQPYADQSITGQWDPLANGGAGAFLNQTGTGQALADARRMLAQTPWRGGFSLDLYTSQKPERLAALSLIAAQWKRLGVRVRQYSVPATQLFASWEQGGILTHGAFQAAQFSEVGGPNPDDLRTLMHSRYIDRRQRTHNLLLDANYAGIRDGLIDRAWDRAARTFNHSVRRNAFREIQRQLNQRAYWITLYYAPTISTSDDHVQGFLPAPFPSYETWNVYGWRMKGG